MGAKDGVSTLNPVSPRVLSVINEDLDNIDYTERKENCDILKSDNNSISLSTTTNATQKQRQRKASTFGPDETDLNQLKATANRLKLNTRRPSYLVWRAQYIIESPKFPHNSESDETKISEPTTLTNDRQERINDSLNWIRSQLAEMRHMDQALARQFLGIRREITRLKLQKSCEAHEDMLEDTAIGMEEFQELSRVLDEPNGSYAPSPLKHLGITKMHFSSRRFSTC